MSELKLIVEPDLDEAEAAEVFVEGTIDGNPYRFLLDTGAARTSVVYDVYTAAFSPSGENHSSGLFAKTRDDLITVPRLEVGPIAREDFTLVRRADTDRALRSLIGMDLLKDFCCHFLFNENRVALDASAGSGEGAAPHALLLDDKCHPYVDVQLGALSAKAVWDTGASITVVDMRVIHAHPAWFEGVGQSSGTDATGSEMATPMFIMAETTIGGHVFPPHRVAGVDLSAVNSTLEVPMDLILGYSTLSKAHWWFDFPRRQWAITALLDTWQPRSL